MADEMTNAMLAGELEVHKGGVLVPVLVRGGVIRMTTPKSELIRILRDDEPDGAAYWVVAGRAADGEMVLDTSMAAGRGAVKAGP